MTTKFGKKYNKKKGSVRKKEDHFIFKAKKLY